MILDTSINVNSFSCLNVLNVIPVNGHWLEFGRDPDVALDLWSSIGNKVWDTSLGSTCGLFIQCLTLITHKMLC